MSIFIGKRVRLVKDAKFVSKIAVNARDTGRVGTAKRDEYGGLRVYFDDGTFTGTLSCGTGFLELASKVKLLSVRRV